MANGYLQLRKKIDYKYVLKKILKILYVVFIRTLFYDIARLILKGNIDNNTIYNVIMNLLQKVDLGHFWFLGSLIIMYLALPIISKIFNNESKKYCIFLTITLSIVCIIIDYFNIRNNFLGKPVIQQSIIQTFRIWTWLTYFCIGGIISKFNILNNLKNSHHITLMLLCSIIFVLY